MSTLDYRDPEWVSEQLGLERNTVYKYLKEGIFPAVRIGKKWLISESRLIEWLKETTGEQTLERRKSISSISRTVKRLDNYSWRGKMAVRTESIKERVIAIITAESGLSPESITPEANLADDISMDSLELVETVMAVEEEFGI